MAQQELSVWQVLTPAEGEPKPGGTVKVMVAFVELGVGQLGHLEVQVASVDHGRAVAQFRTLLVELQGLLEILLAVTEAFLEA